METEVVLPTDTKVKDLVDERILHHIRKLTIKNKKNSSKNKNNIPKHNSSRNKVKGGKSTHPVNKKQPKNASPHELDGGKTKGKKSKHVPIKGKKDNNSTKRKRVTSQTRPVRRKSL